MTQTNAQRRAAMAERLAQERAAQRRSDNGRRVLVATGSIVAVVVVVAVLVLVKVTSSTKVTSQGVNTPFATVVTELTHVPASVTNAVGTGGSLVDATVVQKTIGRAAPLTAGGKPEVLYIGAEYCPYCAAQRWALIEALSRFGTFSGLAPMHSSTTDVYAGTNTFTFVHATYASPYLSFVPVELETNTYKPLETPTTAEQALIARYDSPPYVPSSSKGAIPFVDLGNRWVADGAMYSPQKLRTPAGPLTRGQIATELTRPSSPIAKAIDGSANVLTAYLCQLTGGKPGAVCSSPAVRAVGVG